MRIRAASLTNRPGSGRTLTDLRHTITLLGRQNYPPAKSFATAAHRLLPTAV
jgi:hypothetical protein